jgi:CAAX prenyl protease-like protein
MTTPQQPPLADPSATPPARGFLRDDLAYILPMAIFLVFTQIGSSWPSLFAASYVAKSLVVPVVLWFCWRYYTKIQWTHLWLGALVGVVGLVQWVGMEKLLVWYAPSWTRMSVDWGDLFNPFVHFKDSSPLILWGFITIRWACASLVVPVMEELFWRDFLWRSFIAPADFKLAHIGERDGKAIAFVALLFATVHIQWLTAIVWGLLIAWLLIRTRSIGACIVAHAVTNFLLGLYVLVTGDWYFW